MAFESALQIVNNGIAQLMNLQKGVMTALEDCKISPMEGMMLSMQGSQLALYVLSLAKGLDAETKADMLYVLAHGEVHWTLPDTGVPQSAT